MSLGAADNLAQLPSLGPVGQWAYHRLIQLTIENTQLRRQNQEKDAALRESQVAIQRMQEQMEEAQRKAHRQAAPFRRPDEQRKARPARPGRKRGHRGAYRPKPDHVDQSLPVPLKECPHCHGPVQDKRPVIQYIEEVPVVRPIVTELITEQGWCGHCQQEVYTTHPLQTSRAEGAARVQLGPRALGLAADLRAKGLSMRKTVKVLEEHFGLKLTPGGLALALQRLGRRVAADYDQLPDLLRKSAVVHADDTGWWVGQPGWWLHVFTTSETTCYVVAQGRASGVTLNILGDQFAGTLVSDCASVYDDLNASQQKCYSHHLKAVAEACQTHPQQGEGYLHQIQALLRTAIVLKALKETANPQRWEVCLNQLKARAQALLEPPRAQAEEEKVRKRLWKQRDHLFTFLERVDVPATNNLAERQLRPAVIARKISCGNKTPRGAQAWARLTSMSATCQQRGKNFVDFIAQRVRLEPTRGP
jgi:transposase